MVLAGPFEHLELGLTAEEETLPRAVEMVPQLDGTGDEGAEYVLLDVLNTQQCRTARLGLKFPSCQQSVSFTLQGPGRSTCTDWPD